MESFEGVIEFAAVAEAQGFSAAARQLGCSTSHVSRQVSRLEARLGCALFARTTRLISLTREGEAYYQQCRDLITGLQQANEQIRSEQLELSGTLRVSAAGGFAETFVVPVLVEFTTLHPGLRLEIDFNTRNINFVEDNIDFAIRYGQLKDSGLVARKLVDRTMVAAASKDYLDQHGTPATPEQLSGHSCLVANNEYWEFMDGGTRKTVRVEGRFRSNNTQALVCACRRGLGIAYMPRSSFLGLLDSPDIRPLLEEYCSPGVSSWVVYRNRRFLPMRARLAVEYLLQHFSDWEE